MHLHGTSTFSHAAAVLSFQLHFVSRLHRVEGYKLIENYMEESCGSARYHPYIILEWLKKIMKNFIFGYPAFQLQFETSKPRIQV
jgi:hypothetical protein